MPKKAPPLPSGKATRAAIEFSGEHEFDRLFFRRPREAQLFAHGYDRAWNERGVQLQVACEEREQLREKVADLELECSKGGLQKREALDTELGLIDDYLADRGCEPAKRGTLAELRRWGDGLYDSLRVAREDLTELQKRLADSDNSYSPEAIAWRNKMRAENAELGLIGDYLTELGYEPARSGTLAELRTMVEAIKSDERAAVMKAKVYGEKAAKWRKRAIEAGGATEEDRILADEWHAKEQAVVDAKADRDKIGAALRDAREELKAAHEDMARLAQQLKDSFEDASRLGEENRILRDGIVKTREECDKVKEAYIDADYELRTLKASRDAILTDSTFVDYKDIGAANMAIRTYRKAFFDARDELVKRDQAPAVEPEPVLVTQAESPFFTGEAYAALVVGEPATDGDVIPLSGPHERAESDGIPKGSNWVSVKHNAEVIDARADVVDFWHTHHDGTRSRYCYPRHRWLTDFKRVRPIVVGSTWRHRPDGRMGEVTRYSGGEFYMVGGFGNCTKAELRENFDWIRDPDPELEELRRRLAELPAVERAELASALATQPVSGSWSLLQCSRWEWQEAIRRSFVPAPVPKEEGQL